VFVSARGSGRAANGSLRGEYAGDGIRVIDADHRVVWHERFPDSVPDEHLGFEPENPVWWDPASGRLVARIEWCFGTAHGCVDASTIQVRTPHGLARRPR
jgi:hypothetical protein